MVMGNKATCSFGVAIGHSHSPMQDIIAQARLAEKEAKKVENKHGFCLSIVKRSGEALRFSASLTQNPLLVWTDMAFNQDERSRGFAYHYVQLITPLLTTGRDGDYKYEEKWKNEHTETEELRELVQLELVHVLQRQAGLAKDIAQDKAKCWCEQLSSLPPRDFLHFWMGWAFVERQILKSEKE
jgi:CRISPR/Cas system-associated protein Cas10 (large subunit of type III CRISPR-Cas system)